MNVLFYNEHHFIHTENSLLLLAKKVHNDRVSTAHEFSEP